MAEIESQEVPQSPSRAVAFPANGHENIDIEHPTWSLRDDGKSPNDELRASAMLSVHALLTPAHQHYLSKTSSPENDHGHRRALIATRLCRKSLVETSSRTRPVALKPSDTDTSDKTASTSPSLNGSLANLLL